MGTESPVWIHVKFDIVLIENHPPTSTGWICIKFDHRLVNNQIKEGL